MPRQRLGRENLSMRRHDTRTKRQGGEMKTMLVLNPSPWVAERGVCKSECDDEQH